MTKSNPEEPDPVRHDEGRRLQIDEIQSELPSLQALQQRVLDESAARTRTLIMYAVAAAVLLGLSKKIIIPPFNTVVDIDTAKFFILALIMTSAAIYLVWELWNGVSGSVRKWSSNRDLAYQEFRHVCLSGMPELEEGVKKKLQQRIDRNSSRLRARLTEERNTLQASLNRISIDKENLADKREAIELELKSVRHSPASQTPATMSPASQAQEVNLDARLNRGGRRSTPSSVEACNRLAAELAAVEAQVVELQSLERQTLERRDALEARLGSTKSIREGVRSESIRELDDLFTESVDELVEKWRDQQLVRRGAAGQYSLLLSIQKKNGDFQRLRAEEVRIIRDKAYKPAWLSSLILIAALTIPIWTLGQDVHCEQFTDRSHCPPDADYLLEDAIADISNELDSVVQRALLHSGVMQLVNEQTRWQAAYMGAAMQENLSSEKVTTARISDSTARPFLVGSDSAGLIRLSYPVFERSSDAVSVSDLDWLESSATQVLTSLSSCSGNRWLHVVGYADSALFSSDASQAYDGCSDLVGGTAADQAIRRNLCLANQRAETIAGIFRSTSRQLDSEVKITTRRWQGVQCTTDDCQSEHDMMLFRAGIKDGRLEKTGWLNRRADVHVLSAGSCDSQSIVDDFP